MFNFKQHILDNLEDMTELELSLVSKFIMEDLTPQRKDKERSCSCHSPKTGYDMDGSVTYHNSGSRPK